MTRAAAFTVLATFGVACSGGTPTTPNAFVPTFTRGTVPTSGAVLIANCSPDGQDVSCYATLLTPPPGTTSTDVTQVATWTIVPVDVVTAMAPGRFRALRSGEIAISVTHDNAYSVMPARRFLVAPGETPRYLDTGIFSVMEAPTVPVAGATVEILDGYRAGARCTTVSFGFCEIERIPAGESFSVRVSKSGYQTQTVRFTPASPTSGTLVAVTLVRQ